MLIESRAAVRLARCAWALLPLAAGCDRTEPTADRGSARFEVPLSTPAGITLHPRASKSDSRLPKVVYADASGMTLYFYDGGDTESLIPAVAPSETKPAGHWSVIALPNGGQQWAYRGRALYRSGLDKEIGGAESDGADGGLWHAAGLNLETEIELPGDLGLRETGDALGVVLIDPHGMTLYTIEGDVKQQSAPCKDCAGRWIPMEAPQTATSLGDFTVVKRTDGIDQWAYKGQPLYRYDGDQNPGDVTGSGVDLHISPALVVRHFTPPNVVLHRHSELGLILTTSNGSTLYTRDRIIPGEHQSFRDNHGSPALGRAFGTSTCDEVCARVWPPLIAPAGSLPSGYWGIAKRTGGAMQWTYKGFALYTYSKDQPDEIQGNGLHELAQLGAARTILPGSGNADVNVGGSEEGVGVGGLWWHAVIP